MRQVQASLLSGTGAKFRLSALLAGQLMLVALLPRAFAQVPGGAVSAPAAPAAPALSQTTTTAPSTTTTTTRAANPADDAAKRNAADDDHRKDTTATREEDLTEFQQMVAATTGRRVPIFGASLFNNPPSTFAPVEDVNVGPGYIIGPGDELRLQLSGQINQQLNVVVDRTGAISLPGLGAVHVAGLPFGQLAQYLRDQAGKIYRNFDLSVNMGALRTIQVFVVGEARQPGSYSISSLSTLLNALFVSGGPLPQGSVRDIQVKRGGKTIAHFDLYDLLLHGDKSHDMNLATGDVIFIPTVGPQIAVVGSISNPAIYELKGETTVGQVLALAGGQTSVAAGSSVRLERIYQHTMRSIEDVSGAAHSDEPVQNGDIISVASIVDRFRDAVTLRGNVANPGRYVWHPGMRVSDLIPNKEALITRNYWRKRNLLGQSTPDYSPNPVDTEGALKANGTSTSSNGTSNASGGASNPVGGTRDTTQRTATTPDSGGSSVGNALTPANSIFSAQTDVILSAPDIDWSYAVIERQSTKDLTTSLLSFNLGKVVLDEDPSQNLELLPGDVITIFSKADLRVPSTQQTRIVRLEGEFVGAGVYSVLPGETLRSLLRRAGGFTGDAYLYGSEFTRESTRRVEEQRLREYADQLEAQASAVTSANQARAISPSDQAAAAASAVDVQTAVARLREIKPIGRIVLDLKPDSTGVDSIPDLALEDGDRFIVPRLPSNVNVEGQVYSANAFVFTPGRRVIDYLREAGGPDRQADRKRTFVLRADGSVVSRQYANVDRALIFPGDTIVVPPVIDKRSLMQRIVDVATIVGQFGLGAATIAILSR
ncbi:MAG TPA: SLBB domain-containing protein [Acidobacteriaceae bacterium]|nr:SLBB domain-containing protein [Acidobacteriaceae bacterium]